jgi:hypothetical protein
MKKIIVLFILIVGVIVYFIYKDSENLKKFKSELVKEIQEADKIRVVKYHLDDDYWQNHKNEENIIVPEIIDQSKYLNSIQNFFC